MPGAYNVFMFGEGKWMDNQTSSFSVSVGRAERALRPFSLRSSLFSNNFGLMPFCLRYR